ncbi:Extradiol ring-cleavage dioxygenase, class III enzyme, subunit B [Methanoregula boonei 6A8]|uniref:Extradiol ring-cleavage dioxygenase, class III enzyme, subunit B n=1 Tax=Methanoregula boonei (strain DSM 21154 / JCM 14090 / 6A8) TaxID=456442 RepID=A7I7E5_METB6|nr:4,5-DOPA dioxygenase extradiol [Methanoregula boonei]ABS55656.1 Extradiol ring-cleavage dioxygenase, class III enzyme, subunit B [Methanoregula boonei 6A8]
MTSPHDHPAEKKMPVLFIGHGSPMNMVLDNRFTRHLAALGASLPRPKAILVISAHWLADGSYVTCTDRPRMIYDFYGFPGELYHVQYGCPGAPSPAQRTVESSGGAIRCDQSWGIDHAGYSILKYMFPNADIPVFEMSLDYAFGDRHPKPIAYHYTLAQKLAPLREQGVLIIGSGNIVHNLGLVDFADMDAAPPAWAVEADAWMRDRIIAGEHRKLFTYPWEGGSAASRAVPTLDHYLPMIYALALQEKEENVRFTFEGFQNGSLSMRSFRIG